MEYSPKHLIMVTSANNNKFYNMIPHGDSWTAEYGRVGASCQKRTYSMREWDKKYREKIAKGYKDVTDISQDLIEEDTSTDNTYKPISNESVRKIIERLQQIAKKTISANYTVSSNKVTQAMVDTAQDLLNNLIGFNGTVNDFNKKLIEIFNTIPRKMKNVSDYLSKSKDDYNEIIQREADLLDVMRGQVVVRNTSVVKNTEDSKEITILEELGLEMDDVTDAEVSMIKTLMAESSHKFRKAWKVTNIETQKNFDNYMKDNNLKEKDKKLLFHGSRNENWMSIISTGLKIRPTNAIHTGSMFADGLYFAPKCAKSIGYTSSGYWTRGTEAVCYMALFEVAYGNPYVIYSHDSSCYYLNYDKIKSKGCNCLHAKADKGMLRNDEIVFYNTNQVTIKYLIEIDG